jgi:hypothetical protein
MTRASAEVGTVGRQCLNQSQRTSRLVEKSVTLDHNSAAHQLATDGRQSDAALAIARGTQRCLLARGFVALPEVTLPNDRRADLLCLGPQDELWIIEIKSSVADFRADNKWREYQAFCDRFAFAVAPDFPLHILPTDVGLLVADRFDATILREPHKTALPAARRRALVSRFARTAATRLLAIRDPELDQLNRGLSL